jgi:hypothetical protein
MFDAPKPPADGTWPNRMDSIGRNNYRFVQRPDYSAPNPKRAALPSIKVVSDDLMVLNDTRASGCLCRHVAYIDHHYSDVVGLSTGASVLGPSKHLIQQTFSKRFGRKILVSRNELA